MTTPLHVTRQTVYDYPNNAPALLTDLPVDLVGVALRALQYHMRVRRVRLWFSDGAAGNLWLEQRLDYDPALETWDFLGWCYAKPCSLTPEHLAAYVRSQYALALDASTLPAEYVSATGLTTDMVVGGEFDLPTTFAEYVAALPRRYRSELARYYRGVTGGHGYGVNHDAINQVRLQQQAHMRRLGIDWYTEYGIPRYLNLGKDVHNPVLVSPTDGVQVVHGVAEGGAFFVNTSVVIGGTVHDLLCARTHDQGSLRKGLGFAAIMHNIAASIQLGARSYSLFPDGLAYKHKFWPGYAGPKPLLRIGSAVEVLMGVRNFWLKGQWVEDPVRDGLPLLTWSDMRRVMRLAHLRPYLTFPGRMRRAAGLVG